MALSLVGFILITIGLIQSFRLVGLDPSFLRGYRGSLLFLLSLAIILGWASLGAGLGITLLVASSLVTFLVAIRSGMPWYNLQLLSYVGVGVIMAHFWRKVKLANRLDEIKVEETEETSRRLALEYEQRRAQAEGLKKQFQRYSTLKEVTEALSSGLSLEEVVKLVAAGSSRIVGKGEECLLFLVDRTRGRLALAAKERAKELPGPETEEGNIFDRWVLRQRRPLLITDTRKDFRFSLEEMGESARRWRSLVIAPVVTKERVVGLLRMNSQAPDVFTADDLRLLDLISGLASVAIENALLYKRTEELAIRDGLTRLYVHRYFLERLPQELERAKIAEARLAVFMCDLDHFKRYNDRHGHTAGDILLKRIAAILMKTTEDDALVARYGGEEFAVILPGVSRDEAVNIAQKIRKKVESEIFLIRRARTRITISIGVVIFPEDALTPEGLVKGADGAMYKAKQKGRNLVCTA